MAVYKPSYCTPNLEAIDTHVAQNQPLVLHCNINTSNKKVTGYQMILYKEGLPFFTPSVISPIRELYKYDNSSENNINSGLNQTSLSIPFIQNKNDSNCCYSANMLYYDSGDSFYYYDIQDNITLSTDPYVVTMYNTVTSKNENLVLTKEGDTIKYRLSYEGTSRDATTTNNHTIIQYNDTTQCVGSIELYYNINTQTYYSINQKYCTITNNGAAYTWNIILYQGDYVTTTGLLNNQGCHIYQLNNDASMYSLTEIVYNELTLWPNVFHLCYYNLANTEYDIVLTSGTVLGSTADRIHTVCEYTINGITTKMIPDKILPKQYVQLYDASDNQIGKRTYIDSYTSTYGHIYPITGDARGFTNNDVESADHIQCYKYPNNPDDISAGDMVAAVSTKSLDDSKWGGSSTGYCPCLGLQQVDNYQTEENDLVILKDQTYPNHNGIYRVHGFVTVSKVTKSDSYYVFTMNNFKYCLYDLSEGGYYTGVYRYDSGTKSSTLSYSITNSDNNHYFTVGATRYYICYTSQDPCRIETRPYWDRMGYSDRSNYIGKILYAKYGASNGGKNWTNDVTAGTQPLGVFNISFTEEAPIDLYTQNLEYATAIGFGQNLSVGSVKLNVTFKIGDSTVTLKKGELFGIQTYNSDDHMKTGLWYFIDAEQSRSQLDETYTFRDYSYSGSNFCIYKAKKSSVIGDTYINYYCSSGTSTGIDVNTPPEAQSITSDYPVYIYNKYDKKKYEVTLIDNKFMATIIPPVTQAKVLHNTATQTYVTPFIGMETRQRLFFTGANQPPINTDNIMIKSIDTSLWSVVHDQLKDAAPLSSTAKYKYDIKTFFNTSDENVFYSYSTPTAAIKSIGTVNKPYVTCTGTYDQSQGISWNNYRFILYDKFDNVLQDTGKYYDGIKDTTFVGLLPEMEYKVEYSIEDNLGNILYDTSNFTTTPYPTPGTASSILCSYAVSDHCQCINISISNTSQKHYSVYRQEDITYKTECQPVLLNYNTSTDIVIKDFNIRNGHTYKYYVYSYDNSNLLAYNVAYYDSSSTATNIKAPSDYWSVAELIPVSTETTYPNAKKQYYIDPNKTWLFKYSVETGEQTQNITKTEQTNLSQYPRYAHGIRNNISGTVQAMLGQEIIPYTLEGYIEKLNWATNYTTNDKAYMLQQWRKLVASKNPKLLKDKKGQSFIVQITGGSNTPRNEIRNQPDSISFQWVQIDDPIDYVITDQKQSLINKL